MYNTYKYIYIYIYTHTYIRRRDPKGGVQYEGCLASYVSNLAVPWAVHSRGFSNLAVPCKSLGLAASCAVGKHQVPLGFDQDPPMFTTMRRCLIGNPPFTVSSHEFNLQHFKLRVSNPRTIAYVHFNTPFESSNLPDPWHIFPDRTFGNWPY